MKLLTDTEIGDALDLEKEYTFPCSDHSSVSTVDCRPVAKAQLRACTKDEADTLEAVIMSPFLNADQKVYEIEAHIKELRRQAEVK